MKGGSPLVGTRGELAVITQDPRFRGGALAQLRAFLGAVETIEQPTRLLYGRRQPLRDPMPVSDVRALELRSVLSRLDAAMVPLVARRHEQLVREARSVWVVATIAFYGLAALRSGRPYGAWIGTTYESEQRGRRPGLDPARRLAVALNGPALRRWERDVLRNAALLLAPTEQIADELAAAADVPAGRVGVLPIPIDTEHFAPLADSEWARCPPRLVFVGRADDPRKNLGLLLDAFRLARLTMPDLELRLVGQPPSDSLPEGVEVVGEVSDVASHIRDARLLVLPSLQEGFGVVAAEALACGVPVVTTPCGGPVEAVVGSGAGRVLQGFDPEELAVTALGLVEDEATLVAMRRAARRYALDRYGVDRFRASVEDAMGVLARAA